MIVSWHRKKKAPDLGFEVCIPKEKKTKTGHSSEGEGILTKPRASLPCREKSGNEREEGVLANRK